MKNFEVHFERVKREYSIVLNKYHPDLKLEDSDLVVTRKTPYIKQHYRIGIKTLETGKKNKAPKSSDRDSDIDSETENSDSKKVLLVKDQSYVYFKQGMSYYRQIHPSRWSDVESIDELLSNNDQVSNYEDQKKVFRKIFLCFISGNYIFQELSAGENRYVMFMVFTDFLD